MIPLHHVPLIFYLVICVARTAVALIDLTWSAVVQIGLERWSWTAAKGQ